LNRATVPVIVDLVIVGWDLDEKKQVVYQNGDAHTEANETRAPRNERCCNATAC
jgi:hypothetical protein